MISAGELDQELTILSPGGTGTDDLNQPIEDWTNPVIVATIRAGRDTVRGREFYEARAALGEDVERFVTRHVPQLTRRHRLRDSAGTVYRIEAIDDSEGRNRKMTITVTKLEAGGG